MIEAGRRRDRSAVVRHPLAVARGTGADPRERQPGGTTERLRVRGPEASRHGHEQLVLLSAPHGCEWRDTPPAGIALHLDRNADTRGGREMSRVTRQAVGDADHGVRPPARQPPAGGNPRQRPGEAAPYGRSEAAPPPPARSAASASP